MTKDTDALDDLDLPAEMVAHCRDLIAGAEGVLIYGSRARGDFVESSDLDVLALLDQSKVSANVGNVSVSYYSLEQLQTGIGTLFGAHLKRDGKIIFDRKGRLTAAIEAMGDVDTERLFRRAQAMSTLFTRPEADLPKYLYGLLREARYLLRSCLYARAISEGRPCFSVRELAVRHRDPKLSSLLASRQSVAPSIDSLKECLARLESLVGPFPPNENGSLEATIVNEWHRQGDLLSMAFMALGTTGRELDYAEVEKILL